MRYIEIGMGETGNLYSIGPRCKVCNGKLSDGTPVRDFVEIRRIQGDPYEKIEQNLLTEHGLPIPLTTLKNHVRRHALWVENLKGYLEGRKRILKIREEVAELPSGVRDSLEEIVETGLKEIRQNPKMKVSPAVAVKALAELAKLGRKTEIEETLEEATQRAFNERKISASKTVD